MFKKLRIGLSLTLLIIAFEIHPLAILAQSTQGKLEFRLVDESLDEASLRTLIDEARQKNKIKPGYSPSIIRRLNQALKSKIPSHTQICFELPPQGDRNQSPIPYLINDKVELSGNMLSEVQVNLQEGQPVLLLSFNPEGAKLFEELTQKNISQRLAIMLDETVLTAPRIVTAIPRGKVRYMPKQSMDKNMMAKELEELASKLTHYYRLKQAKPR